MRLLCTDGRYGSLAVKALKYRSADFSRVKAGFMGALCDYAGSPEDAALEDEINGFTQVSVYLARDIAVVQRGHTQAMPTARLLQLVDDLVWAHGLPLMPALETFWKGLAACSDSAHRSVVSHAGLCAAEHHWKHRKLAAIRKGLPPGLQESITPLVQHHATLYERYHAAHICLLALDRASMGAALNR